MKIQLSGYNIIYDTYSWMYLYMREKCSIYARFTANITQIYPHVYLQYKICFRCILLSICFRTF